VRAADVFCGGGGLSQGLRLAGFDVVWGGEMVPEAAETYQNAFPDAEVVARKLDGAELLPAELDLLAGGPPCQPFSSSGKREGKWDPRDGFPVFLGLLESSQPRAFLIEEVPNLLTQKHKPYFAQVVNAISALGYTARWLVIDAADHGVPQHRKRLFMVGFKDRELADRFVWPTPQARQPGIGDAIADLVPLFRAGNTRHSRPELSPDPLEGAVMIDVGRGGTPGEKGTGRERSLLYKLQQPWWPSNTVTVSAETCGSEHALRIMVQCRAGDRFERRLHWREVARLQTFPDDWPWAGGDRAILKQLGNAVPCALGRALGGAVARALAPPKAKPPSTDVALEGFAR